MATIIFNAVTHRNACTDSGTDFDEAAHLLMQSPAADFWHQFNQ